VRALLLSVLIAAGCGFRVGAAASDAGDPDPDSAPLVDAMLDAPGTMLCPWPYAPAYVDPCAMIPTTTLGDLDLGMNGTYAFDSSGSTLRDPSGGSIALTTTAIASATKAKLIWVRNLRVQNGSTLRLTGSLAVVIVATNAIQIDGVVDASSHGASSTANDGAGANPAACVPTVAGDGAPCQHGGSGGGGGGFGTFGGNGGFGGLTHTCVTGQDGISGGAGGNAVTATALRGGCNGGGGAMGDGTGAGLGGRGGGAVYLLARDLVTVSATGKVHAGGAGGREATGGRSSGGGGGSGGMIRIAGNQVVIASGGVLAANGGGGGGGCDGNAAMPGGDGVVGAMAAAGGAKEGAGAAGGAGGFNTMTGVGGGDASRGGGGGGGGGGVIQLQGGTSPMVAGAIISPPAS